MGTEDIRIPSLIGPELRNSAHVLSWRVPNSLREDFYGENRHLFMPIYVADSLARINYLFGIIW